MAKTIPIFKDHDETYRADSCRSLVEAAGRGALKLEALRHGHYPGRMLPPAVLPGIKMTGYWNAPADQNWGLPWHRNEGIELTFLEGGSLHYAAEDHEYLLQPDALTITRPWQLHRMGNPYVTASHLHWIILDVGVRRPNQDWRWPSWLVLSQPDLDELTDILHHNEQPVWKSTSGMRRCFRTLSHAVETDRRGSSISRLTLGLNELFLVLLEMLRSKDVPLDRGLSSSRRTVQLFLDDLRANPEHLTLKWSMQEMASSCGLGITQFVSHVRSLTNMTPMHYLTHCRLEFGAQMLREQPAAAVTDVALTCGFSSSQYFATVFSRRFGCSPREFRMKADGAVTQGETSACADGLREDFVDGVSFQ